MVSRPDHETWVNLLNTFSSLGGSVRKVTAATGYDRALVAQAWGTGWPFVPGRDIVLSPDGVSILQKAVPSKPSILPIYDVIERGKLEARRTRKRIYHDTVKAHERFAADAQDDAATQRALEALAVRSSLLLADQAVKNALQLQLATRSMYPVLAQKLKEAAEERSAGSIMKTLREVAEIGRLGVQQLETAMVLERKHLGKAESIYATVEDRSPSDIAREIERMLLGALTSRLESATSSVTMEGPDPVVIDVSGSAVPEPLPAHHPTHHEELEALLRDLEI